MTTPDTPVMAMSADGAQGVLRLAQEHSPVLLDKPLFHSELMKDVRYVLSGEERGVGEQGLQVPAGASPWDAMHR